MIDEPAIDFNEWKDMFVSNAEDKRDLHVAVHNDTKKRLSSFMLVKTDPKCIISAERYMRDSKSNRILLVNAMKTLKSTSVMM